MGIFLGLLHSKRDGMVGILGLYNSNGCSSVKIENVVSKLRLITHYEIAAKVYLAIG